MNTRLRVELAQSRIKTELDSLAKDLIWESGLVIREVTMNKETVETGGEKLAPKSQTFSVEIDVGMKP